MKIPSRSRFHHTSRYSWRGLSSLNELTVSGFRTAEMSRTQEADMRVGVIMPQPRTTRLRGSAQASLGDYGNNVVTPFSPTGW
jgi:hypothetical protein